MRAALVTLVLAGLLVAAHAQAGTTTVVPDNYPTIQAAIYANTDTVYVKAGTYNESVVITHAVYLSFDDRVYMPQVPVVLRLKTATSIPGNVTIRGFHILGGATASTTGSTRCEFTLCRADSGISCSSMGVCRVTGCTVFGALSSYASFSQLLLNTVVSGGVSASGAAGSSSIACNYIPGPAPIGVVATSDVYVTDNLVRGCGTGITLGSQDSGADRNRVEDCSGTGIAGSSSYGPLYCTNNIVRRCGGVGVSFSGLGSTIDGNTVDSTGGIGMNLLVTTDHVDNNRVTHANGDGMVVTTLPGHMRGNTVLHCAGDGIRIGLCSLIDHNVLGHNGGTGLKVTADDAGGRVRSNTSFGNAGPGFSLQIDDAVADSVVYNIGYGNSVGFQRLGAGSIVIACNDWYGNTGGATSGVSPGANDFALNPLFCNLPADVVTLAAASPALNRVGCGLVGALGQGCATPTAVGYGGESGGASLRAYPQPNHGVVRFAWRPVAEPVRLEVYDAQGALRLTRDVSAGAQEYALRADSGGRVLPAGIYFARLHGAAGELGTCRVVVLN